MESRLSILLQEKGHKIYTIMPNAMISDAAKKMTELGVGALLVMEGDQLKGIISERDIINKLISQHRDVANTKVADIMSENITTVPPTMTVTEAMSLVTEMRFRHLPVVEKGKVIGVISIGDLTRWALLSQAKEISSLTHYIHGEHDKRE